MDRTKLIIIVLGILFLLFVWGYGMVVLRVKKQKESIEYDVGRVLGKDGKEALRFGMVGLLVYDENYVITWTSDFFKEKHMDLIGLKLTAWIPQIRSLFDDQHEHIVAAYESSYFEIYRKPESTLLYVRDVSELENFKQQAHSQQIVVGLVQLDNYMEYQSYENEEIMAMINARLRMPVITWAKEAGLLIRRLRSDRFFVVGNRSILEKERFTILNKIREESRAMNVSISLSMAFAYDIDDFEQLDNRLSELVELAQSRGGDQVAIGQGLKSVRYIGGRSEAGASRSKVRVHTMAQSIQSLLLDAPNVFVVGHVDTDFDCMGAALAFSRWAQSLNKTTYIVLKEVPRDSQLAFTMDHYADQLYRDHQFITPEQAETMVNFEKDLVVMVDHGVPAISSAKAFVEQCEKVVVIDHHRRGDNFISRPFLVYVESKASSTCELLVEMIGMIPGYVAINEAEATLMYLGILVDTNRFKMHTDARTFEAAAVIRSWGANANMAEKALCVDIEEFTTKNRLVQQASMVYGQFMVAAIEDEAVEKTMLAKLAQSLLLIKGCRAAFVMAKLPNGHSTALSARSDGSFNVQTIMESLQGGGHFAAAAVSRDDVNVAELKALLLDRLKEEVNHESHTA